MCQVYAPRGPPRALLNFLGGAFIGASPDVTYSLLIELLVKEGYLVVATPYEVTFDHAASSRRIHDKFNDALDLLRASGLPDAGISAAAVQGFPIYSVGHSNGALMQVLIGSLCTDRTLPQANAILSFNNKGATGAVPFFEQLGPGLKQLAPAIESSPLTGLALSLVDEAVRLAESGPVDLDPVLRFLNQIGPVFGQVRDGVVEFAPSPSENRVSIANHYAVPHNLLVYLMTRVPCADYIVYGSWSVKFEIDTIDETDILESLLRPRAAACGGTLVKLELPGTHATPLAPDFKWEVGSAFSPLDAVAQGLRSAALADMRKLVRAMANFFDSL
eukprot:SM000041S15520  [mRNA]  locus=s41:525235:528736:- [translate_table: standard]